MIIVDTNVILSALLTKGITKVVLTAHKDVFMTPQFCFDELWEHRAVWNINNQPKTELKIILERIRRKVLPVIRLTVEADSEVELGKLMGLFEKELTAQFDVV